MAEFERELIRERTIEGLNRARANGAMLGRPAGSKDKKRRTRSGYFCEVCELRMLQSIQTVKDTPNLLPNSIRARICTDTNTAIMGTAYGESFRPLDLGYPTGKD